MRWIVSVSEEDPDCCTLVFKRSAGWRRTDDVKPEARPASKWNAVDGRIRSVLRRHYNLAGILTRRGTLFLTTIGHFRRNASLKVTANMNLSLLALPWRVRLGAFA